MIIAFALLLQASDAAAVGSDACAAVMERRDEAFRPLAAEMSALRVGNKGFDAVLQTRDPRWIIAELERYPSLKDQQRYAAFMAKLEDFQRRYPVPAKCQQETADVQR